jgi:hypothetical protein
MIYIDLVISIVISIVVLALGENGDFWWFLFYSGFIVILYSDFIIFYIGILYSDFI